MFRYGKNIMTDYDGGAVRETGRKSPQYPFMFFKASTTIADHDSDVVIPIIAQDDQADYEGELVRASMPLYVIRILLTEGP